MSEDNCENCPECGDPYYGRRMWNAFDPSVVPENGRTCRHEDEIIIHRDVSEKSLEPAAWIVDLDDTDRCETSVKLSKYEIPNALNHRTEPLFTADQFVELIERRIKDLQKEDDSVNEMLGDAMSEEDHEKMDTLCKEHNRLMTKVTTLKRLRSEFTQKGGTE